MVSAAFVLCATMATCLHAQTFSTLYTFDLADGADPRTALIQATDGNLYGTTAGGGANACIVGGDSDGCGTIFKINPDGGLTTLYSFCSQTTAGGACADGQLPNALLQASDGNFYPGQPLPAGPTSCTYSDFTGCGTVFKIAP